MALTRMPSLPSSLAERHGQILHGRVVDPGRDGAELRRPGCAPGDVDDAAPSALTHGRHRVADAAHRAAQLVVEGAVPVLLGHGEEAALGDVGGVVDQDVEAAELGERLLEKILNCGDVVEVGRDADDAAVRLALELGDGVRVALGDRGSRRRRARLPSSSSAEIA